MTGPAFFRLGPDGLFTGNDAARGPWSPDHCHAGPVAGLAARAAEAAIGPDKMLTRLTLDILRPLPLAGLRVEAEVTRHSRTLGTTRIAVRDTDGTLCMAGSSMHLVRKDMGALPTAPAEPPVFPGPGSGPFPLEVRRHGLRSFGDCMDVAWPPGQRPGPGPKTVWMRAPALLEGEAQTPVQTLCALADSGNGISWNAPLTEIGFMNTDLTLQVHREPRGDWLASQALSHWQGNGIGMSQAVLHDRNGPVAVALQTLVLHPVG
ncbi:thioesterase family protein [Pukyongiella litopenaei]|uniref:Thioesterase family protein n=1 Tax=Pukyongiella litopenaei TaxID=2605946 RepID=A0A2S0MSZ3_9RHOB|nr:thioesterase family protein [Pukyongiella litopenaei]AVO38986.1 thioesterase family protein [Pukyongiella litopenaei]